MTHSDPAARMEDRLDQLDRWLYRNRHVAGPPGIAVLLVVCGWLAHITGGQWVAVGVAALVFILATDHWLDLPSAREKSYAAACWATGGGWVVAAAWLGLSVWLVTLLAVGTVALGIPWAQHRRVRRGVDVDRAIEAWGDGAAVGLKGTRARGTKAGDGWYSFKLAADEPGTYTLSDYKQRAHRIAARFKVRAEAVSFATTTHEGEVEVTVRDAERQELPAELSTEPATIVGPRPIGATDAGAPLEFGCSIIGHGGAHSVAVGVNGSGKSGFVNLGAEEVAKAPDAILCLVDLSPGAQELKAWRPVCYKFADTVDKAEALFDWLAAVCDDRGRRSESRLFTPDEAHPQISVWMDEGATFFAPQLLGAATGSEDRQAARRAVANRVEKVKQGVRVYRKYGIDFHIATQYGDVEALGDATIQQQLLSGYALVFRCAKNSDPWRVVPASSGMQAGELPASKAGSLYIKGIGIDGTVQGRLRYQDDKHIAKTVAYWADKQGAPEPELVALPGGGPDPGCGDTDAGNSGESAGHDASPKPSVPDFTKTQRAPDPGQVPGRLSPDESRQLIWDTLAGFTAAAYPKQVAEACSKSADLVGMRLRELRDEGRVERCKGGRWRVLRGTEQTRGED